MRVQRIFVRKPVRKRPLKRPRRWEDNNIMMALLRGGLWGREANATGSRSYRPWRAISALVGRPPSTGRSVHADCTEEAKKMLEVECNSEFLLSQAFTSAPYGTCNFWVTKCESLNTIIIRCLSSINSRHRFSTAQLTSNHEHRTWQWHKFRYSRFWNSYNFHIRQDDRNSG